MNVTIEKSKFYHKSQIPVTQKSNAFKKIKIKRYHSYGNESGHISPRHQINFLNRNKLHAKQTPINSAQSQYYLNIKLNTYIPKEETIKKFKYLHKSSMNNFSQYFIEQSKQNYFHHKPCCDIKLSKPSPQKKVLAKKQKQILYCKKVQPLMNVKSRYQTYLQSVRKYVSNFNTKLGPQKQIQLYQLKQIQRQLMQKYQQFSDGNNVTINQYKQLIQFIGTQVNQVEQRFAKRKIKTFVNKPNRWKTESTDLFMRNQETNTYVQMQNQPQQQYFEVSFNQSDNQNEYSESKQSKDKNVYDTVRNVSVLSFQQSSLNISKCSNEIINEKKNSKAKIAIPPTIYKNKQLIQQITQTKLNIPIEAQKSSKTLLMSKKRVGIYKGTQTSLKNKLEKQSKIHKDNKRNTSHRYAFSQTRSVMGIPSVHFKVQNTDSLKKKRNSDASFMRMESFKFHKNGRKNSFEKGHSRKQSSKKTIIAQSDGIIIQNNLIQQAQFQSSSRQTSQRQRQSIVLPIQDALKNPKSHSRIKRMNVRSSNPLCSLLMLSQLQQYYKHVHPSKNHNNKPQIHQNQGAKAKQYNPKYLYIDANQSFTNNTKMIVEQISRMKAYLEANNCGMDELFEIIDDKQKIKNAGNSNKSKTTTPKQRFDFVRIVTQPVFIDLQRPKLKGDFDMERQSYRFADFVPVCYTEHTDQKQIETFVQQVEKKCQQDDLIQKQMMEKVKVKDMVYPFYLSN